MLSLLKKELNSFFASLSGYLVIAIFLLTTSLFLWVFDGNFNIIESQTASLKGFFELAPWLYLFLIPAITMRMFAEEKRTGTIELLITRPISAFRIVWAKYLAALILVFISIAPTLLYFYSVYQLGNPVGSIDTGATWGSYIGLFLLASGYIGIGLFASAISTNQVISFLGAIALSFITFIGFEYVASISLPLFLVNFFINLGINEHYLSLSRGVIDSRDVSYFIALSLLSIFITQICIQPQNLLKRKITTKKTALLIAILIISGIMVNKRLFRIDLTAEKRYTVSETTKTLLNKQSQPLNIDIFLAGKLPSAMKSFQEAIIEKAEDLNAFSPYRIFYNIVDVYEISNQSERNQLINRLIEAGIEPVNFEHRTTEGLSTQQIFPGMIVSNRNESVAINLLKSNPMLNYEENFQQSLELLEYEFTRAIRLLQQKQLPTIAFLNKNGNANKFETADFRYALSEKYKVIDCTANELYDNDSIETLVIAAPTEAFTEQEKLLIDQFIMNGGKVLWAIDPVEVSIDSLSLGLSTLAFEKGINLRDQLFRYGVRINPDLLQDAVCLQYPINTAPKGQSTRFTPAPFYYAPLALPNPNHPLSRNLNNVMLEFSSSVDLVGESEHLKGNIILTTSSHSRKINTPVEVSLLSATNPPDSRLFNQPNIPIGVLLEGKFESAFSNRITKHLGMDIIKMRSPENKMIVITDGNIIKNKVRYRNGQAQIQALGHDQYSGQTFGNRDFLVNCVDYLNDDIGIMSIRSKVIKMRLLDKVKIRDEKTKWKLLNTISPLVLIIVFGIAYTIVRKRKFSR
ncbi:MAG: gliding motility-associated ABC transporter substrate-binding protein GldG [Prolixibacteraceae bacterium]|nr:gliding motility-associated ABC transporter substrate-binding protein GldG [Prolixibacteraceae bacterium]